MFPSKASLRFSVTIFTAQLPLLTVTCLTSTRKHEVTAQRDTGTAQEHTALRTTYYACAQSLPVVIHCFRTTCSVFAGRAKQRTLSLFASLPTSFFHVYPIPTYIIARSYRRLYNNPLISRLFKSFFHPTLTTLPGSVCNHPEDTSPLGPRSPLESRERIKNTRFRVLHFLFKPTRPHPTTATLSHP